MSLVSPPVHRAVSAEREMGIQELEDLSTKAKNITLLGASKVRQENKVLVVCSVRPCTCITSHLIFIVSL